MNQVQMITLLNTLTDIPSFYDHAPVGTILAFGVILSVQPDIFLADFVVYCEMWNLRLDLYTVEKDLTLESKIKKLLNDNDIAWQKTEQYIDSEQVWEVEFEFEVLGNEDIPTPPTPEPTPDDQEGGDGDGEP